MKKELIECNSADTLLHELVFNILKNNKKAILVFFDKDERRKTLNKIRYDVEGLKMCDIYTYIVVPFKNQLSINSIGDIPTSIKEVEKLLEGDYTSVLVLKRNTSVKTRLSVVRERMRIYENFLSREGKFKLGEEIKSPYFYISEQNTIEIREDIKELLSEEQTHLLGAGKKDTLGEYLSCVLGLEHRPVHKATLEIETKYCMAKESALEVEEMLASWERDEKNLGLKIIADGRDSEYCWKFRRMLNILSTTRLTDPLVNKILRENGIEFEVKTVKENNGKYITVTRIGE